jgi:SAM-dependent methyltransferase
MKFKESALAHKLLDGLEGLEIGGSAHNSFGLKSRNVDYTSELTCFKQEEIKLCGEALPVDIVSPGDQLPLDDNSVDFVISSHVIEHFPEPIKALKEWYRVVKPGGYLYIIAPHKERTFDKERNRSTLAELIERHATGKVPETLNDHCSVWITEDFVELVGWLGWNILHIQDTDDKVGNGFTIVVQVAKDNAPRLNVAASVAKTSASPLQPAWANPQRYTQATQPSPTASFGSSSDLQPSNKLMELQKENEQLRRAIADLIIEKQMLMDNAHSRV